MIFFDAAFYNHRYFKQGAVYLLNMTNLPTTHPNLHEIFLYGYHMVSRNKKKSSCNCVWKDMTLEKSFTKTKGKDMFHMHYY